MKTKKIKPRLLDELHKGFYRATALFVLIVSLLLYFEQRSFFDDAFFVLLVVFLPSLSFSWIIHLLIYKRRHETYLFFEYKRKKQILSEKINFLELLAMSPHKELAKDFGETFRTYYRDFETHEEVPVLAKEFFTREAMANFIGREIAATKYALENLKKPKRLTSA